MRFPLTLQKFGQGPIRLTSDMRQRQWATSRVSELREIQANVVRRQLALLDRLIGDLGARATPNESGTAGS